MKTTRLLLISLLLATQSFAAELPYDEHANAKADIGQALSQAQATKKKILLVFGANWCPECRKLDKAIYSASSALNRHEFVTVKVDVGNFNKNLDLAKKYGDPIRKGIPAAVILTADEKVLYAGPLSRLIAPHRRAAKILLAAAAALGFVLAGAGAFVFLKRNTLASHP